MSHTHRLSHSRRYLYLMTIHQLLKIRFYSYLLSDNVFRSLREKSMIWDSVGRLGEKWVNIKSHWMWGERDCLKTSSVRIPNSRLPQDLKAISLGGHTPFERISELRHYLFPPSLLYPLFWHMHVLKRSWRAFWVASWTWDYFFSVKLHLANLVWGNQKNEISIVWDWNCHPYTHPHQHTKREDEYKWPVFVGARPPGARAETVWSMRKQNA